MKKRWNVKQWNYTKAVPKPCNAIKCEQVRSSQMRKVLFSFFVTSLVTPVIVYAGQESVSVGIANSCPEKWAYVGEGMCQQTACIWGMQYKDDPRLIGKGWSCANSEPQGTSLAVFGRRVKAGHDPNCPNETPEIGRNSTCASNDASTRTQSW